MYPTKQEIYAAYQVIDKLYKIGFGEIARNERSFWQWHQSNYAMLEKFKVTCSHGATKAVFVSENIGRWVLKVNHDFTFDYCDQEFTTYLKARQTNLGEYFAATYRLPAYNGIHWYLQEKVESDEAVISSAIVDAVADDLSDDYLDEDGELDTEYLLENMDYDEKLDALFGDAGADLYQFMREQCDSVHASLDLHEGNIGWRNESEYVLFDYSGFGACA